MEGLFTMPALQDLLTSLPKRTATEQTHKYMQCWKTHEQTMELYHAFRRRISQGEAKQLVNHTLTYNDLREIKLSSSEEEFMQKLFKKGVRNKKLTIKLFSLLRGFPS